MVLSRDIERTVRLIKSHVDKLRSWGLMAAAVYSTREGALLAYGSSVLTDVIDCHREEIFTHPSYITEQIEAEIVLDTDGLALDSESPQDQPQPRASTLLLPNIDPPLELRCFQDTRNLAANVVKASLGGSRRKIGWGIPENKPCWWPIDVPWTRRGVQSGVNHTQLKQVIRECYAFHGQTLPPPAPDPLPTQTSVTNQTQQTCQAPYFVPTQRLIQLQQPVSESHRTSDIPSTSQQQIKSSKSPKRRKLPMQAKRGVQSGVNHTQLKQVIGECYAFQDQTLQPPAPVPQPTRTPITKQVQRTYPAPCFVPKQRLIQLQQPVSESHPASEYIPSTSQQPIKSSKSQKRRKLPTFSDT